MHWVIERATPHFNIWPLTTSVAGCHFSEPDEFEKIRDQPIFQVEGGGWTSIANSGDTPDWFMLPEDISVDKLSGAFLRETRVATRLYEHLGEALAFDTALTAFNSCEGVIKLPRAEYYRRFVFPRLPEMSDDEVFRHMHVRTHQRCSSNRLSHVYLVSGCRVAPWGTQSRGA